MGVPTVIPGLRLLAALVISLATSSRQMGIARMEKRVKVAFLFLNHLDMGKKYAPSSHVPLAVTHQRALLGVKEEMWSPTGQPPQCHICSRILLPEREATVLAWTVS